MIFRGVVLLVVAMAALGCGKKASSEGARADESLSASGREDAGGQEREVADEREPQRVVARGAEPPKAGTGAEAGERAATVGVRKLSLDAEELGAIFSKIPRLKALTEDLRLFDEPYDVNVVKRRGSQDVEGWLFSANPILFTPQGGSPHLVVTGKSKKDAFIVALERKPDGSYELASSLMFRNDPGPFVLAYQQNARERIQWTSCWKCKGDGGAIVAKDSGKRVVVIQQ